jgi:hypothetical protein
MTVRYCAQNLALPVVFLPLRIHLPINQEP